MSETSLRVLSCIQPTGEMHIGNYFGAVANWVKMQDKYRCLYGVVDLHAMTMPYKAERLRQQTEDLFIDLLACGIDPEKSTMFVQSLVPEHTELCWIFSCLASFGDLSRMTQFKEKSKVIDSGGGDFISGGLFIYPVLQAADILVYRADKVPVGKDQEQHLELSREIARNFNRQFGDYFPEPKPLFTKTHKIASTAEPTAKMSKSAGEKHYIGLFEDEKVTRKKIKSAVTDSGVPMPDGEMSPGVANLLSILTACGKDKDVSDFTKDYHAGGIRYGDLKGVVAEALVELTGRLKVRRDQIASDREGVREIMIESSKKARAIAGETLWDVRELVGLPRVG